MLNEPSTWGAVTVLGVAAQRAAEIVDGLLQHLGKPLNEQAKPGVMAGISFLFGLACTFLFDVRLLGALGLSFGSGPGDQFVSALAITAGSETTNTVLKAGEYLKDRAKAKADDAVADGVFHGKGKGGNS